MLKKTDVKNRDILNNLRKLHIIGRLNQGHKQLRGKERLLFYTVKLSSFIHKLII